MRVWGVHLGEPDERRTDVSHRKESYDGEISDSSGPLITGSRKTESTFWPLHLWIFWRWTNRWAGPDPVITWYRDGVKVQESARCKVTVEKDEKSYFVTMALTNVTVEDAGKYKVTAKNELGETAANISLHFDSEYDDLP
ncbi:hypothetical protein Pcinc_023799 [Petrolisthes cinctipes]|uniref:Ig-like domain-containing protein n=1 Tax=Petrolisthes cinctipes TaxID=88211 RepID=A0AAE1FBT0_PETCI|nr:hypothetical protein Pcinc_023799 [Petrolisthes cinctipes]